MDSVAGGASELDALTRVEHPPGMKFPAPVPGQGFACWFHWNLEPIENAYRASRRASDKDLAESRKRERKLRKAIKKGKASWVEYDEDGNPGFDNGEALGEEQFQHERSLSLIRVAFLIALYHYWEQRLAKELPRDPKNNGFRYNQKAAFEWLEAFGWSPCRERLNELELIANCAKHSEGRSAQQLYALRPDLFDAHEMKKFELAPGYDTLLISDKDVETYFKAVKASVPRLPMSI